MKNTTVTRRLSLAPVSLEPLVEKPMIKPDKPGSVDKAPKSSNSDNVKRMEEFRPKSTDPTHRFGKSSGSKRTGR